MDHHNVSLGISTTFRGVTGVSQGVTGVSKYPCNIEIMEIIIYRGIINGSPKYVIVL